nr:RICIN domain-containing protein [Kineosporia mesophila]
MKTLLTAPGARRRSLLVIVGSVCVFLGVIVAAVSLIRPGGDEPGKANTSAASYVQPQIPTGSTTTRASVSPAPTRTTQAPRHTARDQGGQAGQGSQSTRTMTRTVTQTQDAPDDDSDTPAKKKPKATKTVTQTIVRIAGTDAVLTGPSQIRNQSTGLCLDLGGYEAVDPATHTAQFTCNAGDADNQEYERLKVGGQYLLRNVKSDLCVDVPNYGSEPAGSDLNVFDCTPGDADNQMFRFQASGSGYQIINGKSNLCVDVSTANGRVSELDQPLTMAECGSTSTQVWTFA